ncbi:MerR family transcriptional regulator [Methylocella sp.]|uniref:MerR family transcriptional regulator n=1 Tax=Methylocella sp. TaxID=1978226 RepID=UPI003C19DF22
MTKLQLPQMLPRAVIAAEFAVTIRTISRWEVEGLLPAPILIRGRAYHPRAVVEALKAGKAA